MLRDVHVEAGATLRRLTADQADDEQPDADLPPVPPHARPVCARHSGFLVQVTEAPLLGSVPLDGGVRAAGDSGVPLVISDPGCPAAVVLSDVAARLPARTRSLSGLQLPLLVTQPEGSGGSCGSTGGCGR